MKLCYVDVDFNPIPIPEIIELQREIVTNGRLMIVMWNTVGGLWLDENVDCANFCVTNGERMR